MHNNNSGVRRKYALINCPVPPWHVDQFAVLGHRGAKGYAPENTLPSFEKAIELGANMTELDVHLSKDGALVVMHDDDVSRTTDGQGKIASLTLAEIKKLDAGSWFSPLFAGTPVPTLEEVVELVKGRILLNIEVKKTDHLYQGIIPKILDVLLKYDMVTQTVISSFQIEYLKEMKRILPAANLALLYKDEALAVKKAKASSDMDEAVDIVDVAVREGWNGLHCHLSQAYPALITKAHRHGIRVRAWNPNEPEQMRPLLTMGVDGIGTDYPDRLLELIMA
ncbi:MAG TPA: glycerophosphodiester phosphodiesterase [Firmicutes bacterium]|nr:glycerophosphodiester phosphodiesterase [Bacillota bacterium]